MHGFNNLGNTCYFNSAIQVLLRIREISSHILNNTYKGECTFTKSYEKLVGIYFSTQDTKVFNLGPVLIEFVKLFPRFKIGMPHDTQDAIFCLIDTLERSYPHIKDLVYGETKQITISPVSKNVSKIPFCVYILNVKQGVKNINTMLNESSKWNVIEDYVDDNGKKHHVATTRNIFSKYPQIFIISFDKKSYVQIDEELQLDNNIYELQSTIIHKGIQYGGHYMSTLKINNEWLIQDDDNLGKLNQFPREDNHFVLVYNLKTPSC
jgi:ubiquitin C-terminal hydrolase